MEAKYLLRSAPNGRFYLLEKSNGEYVSIGMLLTEYPIDKELTLALANKVKKFQVLLRNEGDIIYILPDKFGDLLKIHIKVYGRLQSFGEKLRYIERLQFFTLLEEENYEELIRRLELLYLGTVVEGEHK